MNWAVKKSVTAVAVPPAKPGPAALIKGGSNLRTCNGLREFVDVLGDAAGARVLDLGTAWQSTISFLVDRGCRVSAEDLLRGWKDFLGAEEEHERTTAAAENGEKVSSAALMEKFLQSALQYPERSFHGILAWDTLDYFDAESVSVLMERLFHLLHPGGALLALFHSRSAEGFHRYRIMDSQTVELLPAPTLVVHAHVFRNREILDLFGRFRSSKTFVGRDQIREALFLR